jgi:competence protein ComEC
VPNNASIVLAVEASGLSILLTGDIEPPAQAALIPDLVGHPFDVVKVPHHGSRDQDPRLAPLTAPAIALISVGEGNTYGHPADETVADWEAVGSLVSRTDLSGDVAVVPSADGVAVVPRN